MRRRTRELRGICHATISSAYPETLLNACAWQGLELWDMQWVDACTLTFCCYERQKEELKTLCGRCMCQLAIETVSGGTRLLDFLRRHGTLLGALVTMFMLLLVSSLFVWEVEIYGNETLSQGELLRALTQCGLAPGCYWPGVDNELVKSEMILKLPKLAWIGINFHASRLEVLVRERQLPPEIDQEAGAGDLVAGRAGVIRQLDVRRGKPLTTAGAAVLPGEVLVSGLTDSLSREPVSVRAQGQIMAETWVQRYSICPQIQRGKRQQDRAYTRYALKLGRSRINFYVRDRKSVDGYDKIIDNYKVGIEGIFSFPVTLIVERYVPCDYYEIAYEDRNGMGKRLRTVLEEETKGEILSAHTTAGCGRGLCWVSLQAVCLEDIARFTPYNTLEDP